MKSLDAVSASKNNNTERTAQSVSVKVHVMLARERIMIARYAVTPVCCYFGTHLLRADCSFNYFLPFR